MKIKLDDKATAAIILLLTALFSFTFLGWTGLKVIFGMILVFFLPFYIILDNFNLSRSEKIFFSFFIGVGVFPTIVYWLGVFISFKLAILACLLALICIGVILRKIKKKQKNEIKQQVS